MADVAKVAGVSSQTVSRVLAKHPNVSAVTREAVLAAIDQTGYRRADLARALATGRSMTIGVVTSTAANFSRSETVRGIQQAVAEHGYLSVGVALGSLSVATVTGALDQLLRQHVDGLLVLLPLREPDLLARAAAEVPLAVMDGPDIAQAESIGVNQVAAGRAATEYLLSLGHETVWHVSGPAHWNDAFGRTLGWRQALAEAGREAPPLLTGDWSAESGYRNGQVLGRLDEVTAVFAGSDEMAFGVMRGLAEVGRKVPDDVSVVGMDDIALAAYANPPLTTMRQPFARMGRMAVEAVLDRIDNPDHQRTVVSLRAELVVRESAAPPRSPRPAAAR
jgi:DNA-binding LacI/PurR family transcriptional regulator